MLYNIIDQLTGEVATFFYVDKLDAAFRLCDQFDLSVRDFNALLAGEVVHAEYFDLLLIIP